MNLEEDNLNIYCVLLSQPTHLQAASLESVAEALGRFTPKITLWKGRAILLDLKGVERSPSFSKRLEFLVRRLGWEVKVGRSRLVCHALAAAHYPHFNITQNLKDLPLEALMFFLNPSDVNQLPKASECLMRFQILGLKSVLDFSKLPLKDLGSRFGRGVIEWAQVVRGELEYAWVGFQPQEEVVEKTRFDPEVEIWDLEPLLFALRAAMDRLLSRLHGRGERLSTVSIELDVVNWSVAKAASRLWEISFPIAQGSSAGVLPIVRDVLQRALERSSLEAPAASIELRVLETLPGRASQKNIFDKTEESQEAEDVLMARLIHQLGEKNVFQAFPVESYLPEKTWQPALEQNLKGDWDFSRWKNRPSRILNPPLEAFWNRNRRELEAQNRIWKVEQILGPERIGLEWWAGKENAGSVRDYYRVVTEEGDQLWIFLRDSSQVFLHGFFD